MDIALLVLRVVVGLFFVGHGAQKLFGWFGGHGIDGTAGFFDSIGMRPGRRNALIAGGAEFGGGVLLVLGLVTPLAALMITATMLVAIFTVHAKNGPWVTDSGWEYNAVLIAVMFALTGAGPGEVSLDDAIGWMPDITGTGWAFAMFGAAALGAAGAVMSARMAGAPATAEPATATAVDDGRFTRDEDLAETAEHERPGVSTDRR